MAANSAPTTEVVRVRRCRSPGSGTIKSNRLTPRSPFASSTHSPLPDSHSETLESLAYAKHQVGEIDHDCRALNHASEVRRIQFHRGERDIPISVRAADEQTEKLQPSHRIGLSATQRPAPDSSPRVNKPLCVFGALQDFVVGRAHTQFVAQENRDRFRKDLAARFVHLALEPK